MKRRMLTSAVVEAAQANPKEVPVALVEKPDQGGWTGVPNSAGTNFRPYAVVIPGQMSSQPIQGSLQGSTTEWSAAYQVACYGRSPESVEWVADEIRDALAALRKRDLAMGEDVFRVQRVSTQSIGSISRYDGTDPPTWGQLDTYSIFLSKEA